MEVERNPEPPKMNDELIKLLTELCFRNDDELEKVNGVFVFSSMIDHEKIVALIDKIVINNFSEQIFISGGNAPKEVKEEIGVELQLTESEALIDAINVDKYPNVKVFSERNSSNTLANVTETLKIQEFRETKSLIFIFKSHAAGRGYLTLRKFFPSIKILQQTFNAKYKDAESEITRSNWHTFDFGRKRVWGEYLRIVKYGSRGDIEYEEVKHLVKEIDKQLEAYRSEEGGNAFAQLLR
ncbi:hypothetical protein H6762_04920 [Candidatus Nomurabacteria bacterium]|uniref:DUF218 domain-containing protein n=1 Tax=Candidatus Dojkabacteria bacterium TaxID=2099670 RepID=A0A955KX05_9BACT|nr:hypothetical protein [Candidatus Dojkabacteria bacterium]MCB9790290.1 hypothetical protein [Candidatus Nomurabacteria bacterium]